MPVIVNFQSLAEFKDSNPGHLFVSELFSAPEKSVGRDASIIANYFWQPDAIVDGDRSEITSSPYLNQTKQAEAYMTLLAKFDHVKISQEEFEQYLQGITLEDIVKSRGSDFEQDDSLDSDSATSSDQPDSSDPSAYESGEATASTDGEVDYE